MKYKNIHNKSEEQLVSEIIRHNKLYWEESNSEITDTEFDLLMRRLEEINPKHELLQKYFAPEVSSVGVVVSPSEIKMVSLEKTYFFDNDAPKGKKSLMAWAKDRSRNNDEIYLIQPKYDGISAYYDGKILATRGQSTADQNVSDKIPLIELEATNYTGPLDRPVRGEIIIRNKDFKEIYSNIKRKDGSCYKNSRNAVSGIMALKDIKEVLLQGAKLSLVDYNLVSFSVSLKDLPSKWQNILEEIELMDFPIDGIVVKLADIEYRNSLGETAMYPKGMLAWKLTGARKETILKDVMWSFGKNNLTPKGILEPIELSGVTISNVTLHNYQYIIDRDIQIGDTLTIERAGEVIPHVVGFDKGENRTSPFIDKCPSCNSKVEVVGVELRCTNPTCPEKIIQRLSAAVKDLGIEELGEPTIRKMTQILSVQKLKDILNLSLADIYKIDGFKEKSATKLFNNIKYAKNNTTDFKLLAALNIIGVGQTFAKSLLREHSIEELRELSIDELLKIDQVGPTMSQAIYNAFRDESDIIDELLESVKLSSSKGDLSQAVVKTICFTGKMPEKRSYYEKIAFENGYTSVDKVNKQLNTLVLADLNSNSSKAQKAHKLGINVVSLNEWLKESELTTNEPQVEKEELLPGF